MSEELKGTASISDLGNDYNALMFMIKQQLLGINTAELVKVEAVNGDNTVDIKPLLSLPTAQGTYIKNTTIYNIPYTRIQGGKNALDIKPEVGDIGIVVYCQRDISNVLRSKGEANPNSNRFYSASDGVYVASIASLNSTPENFIKIDENGVNITTSKELTIKASKITANCDIETTGDVKANGISLKEHTHQVKYIGAGQGSSEQTATSEKPE